MARVNVIDTSLDAAYIDYHPFSLLLAVVVVAGVLFVIICFFIKLQDSIDRRRRDQGRHPTYGQIAAIAVKLARSTLVATIISVVTFIFHFTQTWFEKINLNRGNRIGPHAVGHGPAIAVNQARSTFVATVISVVTFIFHLPQTWFEKFNLYRRNRIGPHAVGHGPAIAVNQAPEAARRRFELGMKELHDNV